MDSLEFRMLFKLKAVETGIDWVDACKQFIWRSIIGVNFLGELFRKKQYDEIIDILLQDLLDEDISSDRAYLVLRLDEEFKAYKQRKEAENKIK